MDYNGKVIRKHRGLGTRYEKGRGRRVVRGAAVNGQLVPQDECSSDGGLHCAIDERVVEHNQVHREVVIPDPVPNSEEAGSWYYVVDCATCKAVIPFKHALEGEPILRFPTMGVRCFQCRTVHTYAADLVSHRKAVPPPEIFKGGPTVARDSVRDAFQYRQEDHSVADSGGCGTVECKIEPDTSCSRRDDVVIEAVSGKRTMIFFSSSCFFAAACIIQLALKAFHTVPLAAFDGAHSFGPTVLLDGGGLSLFIFGMGGFLVDTCGFKRTVLGKDVLALITSNAFRQSLTTWINSKAKAARVTSLARQTRRALLPVISGAAAFRSRIELSPKLRLRHDQ
jgi:hypothetical protein